MDLFNSLANTFSGLFSGAPPPPREPRSFSATYKAMPMIFADKGHLDMGNKVIMPPSALAKLTRLNVEYPMMFTLVNNSTGQKTHVGVMEFSAPEGIAYIPLSVFNSLKLITEEPVTFANIVLPKGTFVKIQPHKTLFTELSNPKAVLERSLRAFSCLTAGETITIEYANIEFDVDILEVKPNILGAISLIDTDVQVEFAAPKDYVEPKPAIIPVTQSNAQIRTIKYENEEMADEKTLSQNAASPQSSRPDGYRMDSSSHPPTPNVDVPEAKPGTGPRRTAVVQGQWRYIYEVDPSNQRRRLVRRDPVTPAKAPSRTIGHSLQ